MAVDPLSPSPSAAACLSNIQSRDVGSLEHPYTNFPALLARGPLVLKRGKGVYVWDAAGKRYIEGMAGLWSTALGYGNEEMAETARQQISTLSYAHLFAAKSHEAAIALAEKIKELSPAPASHVLYTSSGSEANDTQIKLAWYYNNAVGKPQKKKFISRRRAYHGVTLGAASLTGLPVNHESFDLPLPGFLHLTCPHHYREALPGESEEDFSTRLAEELESTILREGPDTVAAFIAEPVMGAGGVVLPPRTYFEKIQAALAKYDVALIADEVICGFGRTGEWFGSQTFGLKPASASMAKALTSSYAPLGAVTIPPHVHDVIQSEGGRIGAFGHGFTYGGHPLAAALGLKAIEIYEREDIVGHVRKLSPAFQARLKALGGHPLVGEARGVGLMGGLELVADKKSKTPFPPHALVAQRVARCCEDEGLILRQIGDTLVVCPPLIIQEDEIDALFDMVERALDRTEAHVEKEGMRGAGAVGG
jgi:4-aminobutyrate--pyruvate transaminase